MILKAQVESQNSSVTGFCPLKKESPYVEKEYLNVGKIAPQIYPETHLVAA
jgi:hypothetical protein